MNHKSYRFPGILLLLAALVLAGCSPQTAASEKPADSAANNASDGAPAGSPQGTPMPGGQNIPLTARLAMGTLLLEDTDLKVDSAQAASLLPLWKAVKSLSASETATADEINAVYDQIQETLTAEQIAAIEAMNVGPEEMAALGEKYAIQGGIGPGGMNGGELSGMTDDQRATRVAELRANAPGGGPGGQGGPQGGFIMRGGSPPEGMQPPEGFDPNTAQGTPDPSMTNRRGGMGMNSPYLEAVIKLLGERAKE